jgi:ferredoxin/flavodoxin---NADP+ reductase
MFEILKREEMANGTVVLNEISAPRIAGKAKPGQFVMLKATETGERIPLTMADTDAKKGTVTVIYAVVGKSTALFKSLQVGDKFQDVIGPLGQPRTWKNWAPWSVSAVGRESRFSIPLPAGSRRSATM